MEWLLIVPLCGVTAMLVRHVHMLNQERKDEGRK